MSYDPEFAKNPSAFLKDKAVNPSRVEMYKQIEISFWSKSVEEDLKYLAEQETIEDVIWSHPNLHPLWFYNQDALERTKLIFPRHPDSHAQRTKLKRLAAHDEAAQRFLGERQANDRNTLNQTLRPSFFYGQLIQGLLREIKLPQKAEIPGVLRYLGEVLQGIEEDGQATLSQQVFEKIQQRAFEKLPMLTKAIREAADLEENEPIEDLTRTVEHLGYIVAVKKANHLPISSAFSVHCADSSNGFPFEATVLLLPLEEWKEFPYHARKVLAGLLGLAILEPYIQNNLVFRDLLQQVFDQQWADRFALELLFPEKGYGMSGDDADESRMFKYKVPLFDVLEARYLRGHISYQDLRRKLYHLLELDFWKEHMTRRFQQDEEEPMILKRAVQTLYEDCGATNVSIPRNDDGGISVFIDKLLMEKHLVSELTGFCRDVKLLRRPR